MKIYEVGTETAGSIGIPESNLYLETSFEMARSYLLTKITDIGIKDIDEIRTIYDSKSDIVDFYYFEENEEQSPSQEIAYTPEKPIRQHFISPYKLIQEAKNFDELNNIRLADFFSTISRERSII